MSVGSLRFRALERLREACASRGLTLVITSSHPTARRPMHNGPVEWVAVSIFPDPRSPTQANHYAAGLGEVDVLGFLDRVLVDTRAKWPRQRGGWPARRAKDAELTRAQLTAYRKSQRNQRVLREQALARGEASP
jgi:hypothetical protein